MVFIEPLETRQLLSGSNDVASTVAPDEPTALHVASDAFVLDADSFTATADATAVGATHTTLTLNKELVILGKNVRATARVTVPGQDGRVPAGIVRFSHGTLPLGDVPLGTAGEASLSFIAEWPAPWVTASFIPDPAGEPLLAGSTSRVRIKVRQETRIHLRSVLPSRRGDGAVLVATMVDLHYKAWSGRDEESPYDVGGIAVSRTIRAPVSGRAAAPLMHVPPSNARTNIFRPTWPPPEPRVDPIPTGRVIFMAGKRVLGKARLDAKGVARLRAAELPPGANIRAFYQGDVTFAPRRSSLIQTYGGRIPTELHLLVHSPRGEVSIDAVLRGMTHRVPGGLIRIYDGDELLTSIDLSSTSSQSKARTLRLRPGVHRIRAFYSGDEHFRSCRSAVVELKVPGSIGWGD